MKGAWLRVGALVGLVAAMSACTYWSDDFENIVDQSNRDFERDPGKRYMDVDFKDILAHPGAYKSVDVRFSAIYNRKGEETFVAMYGPVRPEDYVAFSLWPVGGRLWTLEDRLTSVPTFYLRKDNPDVPTLAALERYSIVIVRGRIITDFQKLPFLEVHYIEVDQGPVYTDDAIAGMVAGMQEAAEKRPSNAIVSLEAALMGTLPSVARASIHFQLGALYEERGEFAVGLRHYSAAIDQGGAAAPANDGINRCRSALEKIQALQEQLPGNP